VPLVEAGAVPDTRGTKPLTWREEWQELQKDKRYWGACERVFCGKLHEGKPAQIAGTIDLIDTTERLIRDAYAMGSRLSMMLEMLDRMPVDQIGDAAGTEPDAAKSYMRQLVTDIYNELYPPDEKKR
jgi:hypothetical protein